MATPTPTPTPLKGTIASTIATTLYLPQNRIYADSSFLASIVGFSDNQITLSIDCARPESQTSTSAAAASDTSPEVVLDPLFCLELANIILAYTQPNTTEGEKGKDDAYRLRWAQTSTTAFVASNYWEEQLTATTSLSPSVTATLSTTTAMTCSITGRTRMVDCALTSEGYFDLWTTDPPETTHLASSELQLRGYTLYPCSAVITGGIREFANLLPASQVYISPASTIKMSKWKYTTVFGLLATYLLV